MIPCGLFKGTYNKSLDTMMLQTDWHFTLQLDGAVLHRFFIRSDSTDWKTKLRVAPFRFGTVVVAAERRVSESLRLLRNDPVFVV